MRIAVPSTPFTMPNSSPSSRYVSTIATGSGEYGTTRTVAQPNAAAAGPGDEVLYSWRSFEAYPGLVAVAGATSVAVPNGQDGEHDVDAMLAAVTERTRVVIVCTPN